MAYAKKLHGADGERVSSRLPCTPLVLAKPGSGAPPFFLVHGIRGSVMELTQLGKLIDYEGPVYAIQARGLDRVEPPIDNVDEMADYYLRAISEI